MSKASLLAPSGFNVASNLAIFFLHANSKEKRFLFVGSVVMCFPFTASVLCVDLSHIFTFTFTFTLQRSRGNTCYNLRFSQASNVPNYHNSRKTSAIPRHSITTSKNQPVFPQTTNDQHISYPETLASANKHATCSDTEAPSWRRATRTILDTTLRQQKVTAGAKSRECHTHRSFICRHSQSTIACAIYPRF